MRIKWVWRQFVSPCHPEQIPEVLGKENLLLISSLHPQAGLLWSHCTQLWHGRSKSLAFWQFFERLWIYTDFPEHRFWEWNEHNRDYWKLKAMKRNGRTELIYAHKISRNLIWMRFCNPDGWCQSSCMWDKLLHKLNPGAGSWPSAICMLGTMKFSDSSRHLDKKQIQKLQFQYPNN